MCRKSVVLLCCVLSAAGCDRNRGGVAERDEQVPFLRSTQPIDWEESAGVFIGIEQFHPGADRPEPVVYAADDATDLAYYFTKERTATELLPAAKASLLLSGRPHKPQSLQHLQELERVASVVVAEGSVCIDAAAIYARLQQSAQEVGRNGILIVSIATHGFTVGHQQLLLTCDSPLSQPKGVVLGRMLQALHDSSGRRLLLLVDACRTPRSGPPFSFEDLDLPAGYAVLYASSPQRDAKSDPLIENGFFTRAVLDGLQCRAPAGPDQAVSPRELDAYVARRARQLSRGSQRPEGRRFSQVMKGDDHANVDDRFADDRERERSVPVNVYRER